LDQEVEQIAFHWGSSGARGSAMMALLWQRYFERAQRKAKQAPGLVIALSLLFMQEEIPELFGET
ncbi:hypothetical protein, partial [Pseudoduganella aquatica]|uniref:hypothetical protein n=1 Tax=Pseudoduganella aquatica TaxID=2660641 RepID=UPI001CB705A6